MLRKIFLNLVKLSSIVFLLVLALSAKSATTPPLFQFDQVSHSSSMSNNNDITQAQSWGLSTTDFQKYQQLMNTTRYGSYYKDKDLDPNLVLAFAATNQADYNRFLAQAVKNDHDRIARELKVSVDYQAMSKKLYPNEKPIQEKP